MFEHMNDYLLMKNHKHRSVELLDEARRARLKREILRRAARQQVEPAILNLRLVDRVMNLLELVRPTSKSTITLADECGC